VTRIRASKKGRDNAHVPLDEERKSRIRRSAHGHEGKRFKANSPRISLGSETGGSSSPPSRSPSARALRPHPGRPRKELDATRHERNTSGGPEHPAPSSMKTSAKKQAFWERVGGALRSTARNRLFTEGSSRGQGGSLKTSPTGGAQKPRNASDGRAKRGVKPGSRKGNSHPCSPDVGPGKRGHRPKRGQPVVSVPRNRTCSVSGLEGKSGGISPPLTGQYVDRAARAPSREDRISTNVGERETRVPRGRKRGCRQELLREMKNTKRSRHGRRRSLRWEPSSVRRAAG